MKKMCIVIIEILIVLFIILKLIPMLILWKYKPTESVKTSGEVLQYGASDLVNCIFTNLEYNIDIIDDNSVLYNQNYTFYVKNNSDEINRGDYVEYTLNTEKGKKYIDEKEEFIELKLHEGKNELDVKIKENNNIKKEIHRTIYYVEPYQKQFLDEFSNKGTVVHYRDGRWEKYDNTIKLLLNSGTKNVRSSFIYRTAIKDNGFNFEYYDEWIPILTNNNINIIACVTGMENYVGEDNKINSEEEVELINKFIMAILERYPQIKNYEILNEPNNGLDVYNNKGYVTQEYYYWYAKTLENIKQTSKKYKDISIIAGSAWNPFNLIDNDTSVTAKTFFNSINSHNAYGNSDAFSYHPYDWSTNNLKNSILKKKLSDNYIVFNETGGFIKQYITEYGVSSSNDSDITEQGQAEMLVQQSVVIDNFNIDMAIQYNFWNTGNDTNSREENFGLLSNDYTPKLAYYAMKNYYENTNGAEYIGKIKTSEELEVHVYDKDGKPVVIAWSNNNDKNIEIDYKNFIVKDIYGEEIKPNENGKLQITTSPVYIYNLDNKYYYKAISNTALQKYTEFEQKFQPEISNIPGLQQKIDSLKQYIKQTENKTTESENIAKQKIKEHFELGNTILSEYKKGQVNIEYVKLSSMLDLLNEIGNSYEDLVTVSAKTRNPNLSETKTIINDVEKNINNNADLEIIYPQKILEFSKDLYEKAEYINNLEEENDIKTGLIVSNDLHAKYLVQWSKEFTDIYIEDYIKNNPITEEYSTKEFTNQDVTVTLNVLPDTKITNNKNSNIYTFTQNGEFIFEYQRRGRNFTKAVKVENIDKIAPQILNIKNNAQYTENIIPKIEEENLEKVTLTKNEKEVEYKLGEVIKEEGKYKLTVTDKAGNTSEVNFEIKKEQENSYIIDENKIRNIKNNTTKEDFIKKLNISGKVKILHNDKELEPGNIISSGDILKCENGKTYTLIVAGDINKDGKVTAYDLSMLRKTILNVKELNEIEKLAADVNCDNNKIGAKDYSSMKLIILGK